MDPSRHVYIKVLILVLISRQYELYFEMFADIRGLNKEISHSTCFCKHGLGRSFTEHINVGDVVVEI